MIKGRLTGLADKYRSLVQLTTILLFLSISASSQTYDPSLFTVTNKSLGIAQAVPTDARSQYWDNTNFVARDYASTNEVWSYLNLPKYRYGHFPIYIHLGGALGGNGVWTGGITQVWFFKDSVGNANLVRWYTDSTGIAGGPFYAVANNLSEGNAGLIKGNLALDMVNNTSDAQKNAAAVALTNHTISGSTNTLTNIPNSALTNSTIGLTLNNSGSTPLVTTTPVALGSSIVLNIPYASASNSGFLNNSNFTYFSNKIDSVHISNDSIYDCIAGTCTFRGYITAGSGGGITTLNGLTTATQTFATGTSGSDFNIVSVTATHTFNFPNASASNRGLLTPTDWSTFNNKQNTISLSNTIDQYWNGFGNFVGLNSDSMTEGTNHLFFTNTRARASISLTTTGSSGVASYNSGTGVLNIPNYSGGAGITNLGFAQYALYDSVTSSNGTGIRALLATHALAGLMDTASKAVADSLKNRTYTFPFTLTSLSATSPLLYNNTTGVFSIQQANTSQSGYLSSTDWNTFNNKGNGTVTSFSAGALSPLFTTSVATGTTTPALTFSLSNAAANSVLGNNTGSTASPAYFVPTSTTLNGWFGATIQGAISLTTTGTSGASTLSGTTLNIPQYQGALTLTTTGTSGASTLTGTTLNIPQYSGGGGGSVLTDNSLLGNGTSGSLLKIDSARLANHLGIDSLAMDTLGLMWYDTAFVNFASNYYTEVGATSISLSGNQIVMPNTTNNDYSIYLNPNLTTITGSNSNYNSYLPSWNRYIVFQLTSAPSSTTWGIGIGRTAYPIVNWIDLTTGPNAGKLFTAESGSNLDSTSTSLTFSQNDMFRMQQWYSNDTVYCTVFDITKGTQLSINYPFNHNFTTIHPDKVGYYAIYRKGGAYLLYSDRLASKIPINAPLAVFGNSKANGDYQGPTDSTWVHLFDSAYTRTLNFGSSGDLTATLLTRIQDVLNARPKQVLLEVGCNDIRAAIPTATWIANYLSIVSQLSSAGIKVYHTCFWENALNQNSLDSFLLATYPTTYIRAPFVALQTCGTACLAPDGVHPNSRGADTILVTLMRDGRMYRNNYRINGNFVDLRNLGFDVTAKSFVFANPNTTPVPTLLVNDRNRLAQATPNNAGVYALGGNTFGQTSTIGTNDNFNLIVKVNGQNSVLFEPQPLYEQFFARQGVVLADLRIDSLGNIGLGQNTHHLITSGASNTSYGSGAASILTTGSSNSFFGVAAGIGVSTASFDASLGYFALSGNNGSFNTMLGGFAGGGTLSTTFNNSTGVGYRSLYSSTGSLHAALGAWSGVNTTSGTGDVFVGDSAGWNNTTGSNNVVIGHLATVPLPAGNNQFNFANISRGIMNTSTANGKDSIFGKETILDSLAMPNLASKAIDTTTYKPLVISAAGDVFRMNNWPMTGGGSGVTTVGTFSGSSQTNGASISGTTITFGPADATNPGMIKATGSQTLGATLTMPAPFITGLASAGSIDSVVMWNPSTNKLEYKSGTFNLYAANGLTAAAGDSFYLGGTLNQSTTINTAGFPFFISGPLSLNGLTLNRNLKSANYTLTTSDNVIYVSASTGTDTIFLPSSILSASYSNVFTIVRLDNSANNVVVSAGSNIIGFAGPSNINLTQANQSISVQSYNSTTWAVIGIGNSQGSPIKYQHVIFTPTTGGTVSLVNNQYNIINPSGSLLALTLNLPSSPANNDVVYIKFTQTVSTVTYANGTVVDGITAPTAGGLTVLTYDSGTTSWY